MLLCFAPLRGKAGGIPILYQTGDDIKHVSSIVVDGERIQIGVHYDYFKLFWIPCFNFNKEYVVYNGNRYSELDYDEVSILQDVYGLPSRPKLPFWQAWGGKLVLLILIGIVGFIIYENNS